MYSNPLQWQRIQKQILTQGRSIRAVARREGMSRETVRRILDRHPALPAIKQREGSDLATASTSVPASVVRELAVRQRWLLWIYELERGAINDGELTAALSGLSLNSRKRVLAVMAGRQGFSERTVAENLDLSRTTVARYRRQFLSGGVDALLGRKVKARLADKEDFCKQLFSLLHEPPSLHGFNRTTWRLRDLQQSLAAKDYSVCLDVIREAIRKAGFRWRAAKVVLTSTDPKYREKLDRVRSVLSALQDDERFFSIDEYGPFAIKAKAGRVLTAPGEMPSVQQWQKSKGWLIATVALELSRNQITHFYSLKKIRQKSFA